MGLAQGPINLEGTQKMQNLNTAKKEEWPPLIVVFQGLLFNTKWDISNGLSLWSIFILNNIVETLARFGDNFDMWPALASGWEFSEDKKTVKFFLSDKYKFHDGKTITPEDVLYSLKRAFHSEEVRHSKISDSLIGPRWEDSLVLNGNTIEMRLKEPLNGLICKLCIPEVGVAPQDYAKRKTHKESLNNLSGPYKVIDFIPEKLSLEKHLGHPLLHEKSPDRVDIIEIPEVERGIEYYQNHDNVMLVGSGYEKIAKYMNLEGEKHTSVFALTEYFTPNIESPRLNTEAKRREIFSIIKMAFEKIRIDERVATKTDQLFNERSLARLEESQLKNLYDKNPIRNPFKLSVALPVYYRENPIPFWVREQLKSYGVELEIIQKNQKELMENKDYDLQYRCSGVSALDPILEMIYLFNIPWTGPTPSKATLETLERAKIEPDREKYLSLLKKIHLDVVKEYRILPLVHTKMVYCAKGCYQLKELDNFDGEFNLWDWHKQ